MEYLLCLMTVFGITIFLQWRYNLSLYDSARQRVTCITALFIIGTIWDTFAVYRGHWSFGTRGSVGLHLGVLPLEEYLFFFIVPYFILVIYKLCTRSAEAHACVYPERELKIVASKQVHTSC